MWNDNVENKKSEEGDGRGKKKQRAAEENGVFPFFLRFVLVSGEASDKSFPHYFYFPPKSMGLAVLQLCTKYFVKVVVWVKNCKITKWWSRKKKEFMDKKQERKMGLFFPPPISGVDFFFVSHKTNRRKVKGGNKEFRKKRKKKRQRSEIRWENKKKDAFVKKENCKICVMVWIFSFAVWGARVTAEK
jgi:hypothetical protein